MSSSKNGLLKCIKFEFWHVSIFSCNGKKDRKIFAKNTVMFWHNIAYMVNSFVFIRYDNYDYRLQKLLKVLHVMRIVIIMTYQWFTLIPI